MWLFTAFDLDQIFQARSAFRSGSGRILASTLGTPAAVGGPRDAPERPARWDGENFEIVQSNLRFFVSLIVMVPLTGCIGGLAKMERVAFVDEAVADQALVNIVRPRVFLGDGANNDIWDGDKFIGTLGAGKLIQYKAIPGYHVFMVYVQGQWGAARGEALVHQSRA